MRDLFLRAVVVFGAVVCLLTELLSPFHALRRPPLAVAWILVALAAAAWWWVRRPTFTHIVFRPVEAAIGVAIAAIAAAVGLAAWLSPPNSADAMAYHMPRIVYWAQSGSVAFFPTPYFNQITLQPLAEYVMLHTYVITGGDRLINMVTCAAFLGGVVGVSALGAVLGLTSRGQAFAALFCATLPDGILQASGAKNECLLALWLVAMAYFAARRDVPFLGLSVGLALATKATAYIFAPPLLAAMLLWMWMDGRAVPWRRLALWAACGVLLLNGPQYLRNLRLSGSPLGYDSAQGNGFFRWRNESPGWKSTVSNALRNASEQLGARSPRWNQAVYNSVVTLHRALGLDPQDPGTTWRWSRYAVPLNSNHEADANNRWHLLLAAMAAVFAAGAKKRWWMVYAAALATAFLLFCFYLKWQPFLARLELPLFVLAAPLAGLLLESLRPPILAWAVCLFLLAGARLPALENWTRPLRGPHNLRVTRRDDNYFRDMGQWNNRASYVEAVERTAQSGCATVGLDISENQLEYPFQALLRERHPEVRFVHTGVENASARYAPRDPPKPCAVLCPDCIENQRKIAMYRGIGPPLVIGRFLLFLAPPHGILPAK